MITFVIQNFCKNMIERIKKIIEAENIGLVKFADEIGVGSPALSHYLRGRNKVSLELVTKILERFRGINPEWLLFGRGEMYKSAEVKVSNRVPDLFSSVEQDVVPQIANEDEKMNPSTADDDFLEPEPLTEKGNDDFDTIQPNEHQSVVSPKTPPKEHASIEKIIVMYSDSTFDCYLPNGRRL